MQPVGRPPVRLGRYRVIEVQTANTHDSYRHVVEALSNALDLHADDFSTQVAGHPDWPGRKVEGPNISNVFKRTSYQVVVKLTSADFGGVRTGYYTSGVGLLAAAPRRPTSRRPRRRHVSAHRCT
jgi:hypothetical protein